MNTLGHSAKTPCRPAPVHDEVLNTCSGLGDGYLKSGRRRAAARGQKATTQKVLSRSTHTHTLATQIAHPPGHFWVAGRGQPDIPRDDTPVS